MNIFTENIKVGQKTHVKKDYCVINYINNIILNEASKLDYIIKADAPKIVSDLRECGQLIVWSGASEHTIFNDKHVNWALRALHDVCHLETGLDFTPDHEIELGRLQALKYANRCQSLVADLIYIEVAEQARYYKEHGIFLKDQVDFTLNKLKDIS